MDTHELAFAGAAQQARMLADGIITAPELLGVYLERIGRLDPELRSYRVVLADSDLFSGAARPDVWTPELVEALKENYFLKFTDVWYTYEPKP